MKGLLTKDFALFFQRKKTFIFLCVWAVVMAYTMNGSFMIGWMTIISSFFAISSITYDEYDNCYPFLMSLPVNGKIYALEKYVFGFICGMAAWIFATVVYLVIAAIKGESFELGSELVQLSVFIPVFMFLIDISLPLNLKFGGERARVIIIILWGVIFVGAMLMDKIFKMDIDIDAGAISAPAVIGLIFLGTAVLTAVSMLLSVGIMKKKEY